MPKDYREMHSMIAISTAHLSRATRKLLDTSKRPIGTYKKGGFGWFMFVPFDYEENEAIPDDVKDIYKFARANKADWIVIDCDVLPYPNLKLYEKVEE